MKKRMKRRRRRRRMKKRMKRRRRRRRMRRMRRATDSRIIDLTAVATILMVSISLGTSDCVTTIQGWQTI